MASCGCQVSVHGSRAAAFAAVAAAFASRLDCGLAGRCAAEVLLRFPRDSAAALLGVQSATLTTLRAQIPHDHVMLRVSKG